MNFKILSLNCQKNYHPDLEDFLKKTLSGGKYDFFLLQEATEDVLNHFAHFNSYSILEEFNDEGKPSILSIVYRNEFTLGEQGFIHFLANNPAQNSEKTYCSYGFLFGVFSLDSEQIVVGSVHLPAGVKRSTRKNGVLKIKAALNKHEDIPIIFAGDCNLVLPGEREYF